MRRHKCGGIKSKRSRGGCSHCRQLRIKCDQQFPTCNQCTKRRRVCDVSETGFRSYTPAVGASTRRGSDGIALSPPVSESITSESYSLREIVATPDYVVGPSTSVAHPNDEAVSRDIQTLKFQSSPLTTSPRGQVYGRSAQSTSGRQQSYIENVRQSSLPVEPFEDAADNASGTQGDQHRRLAPMEPLMQEEIFDHSLASSSDRNPGNIGLPDSTAALRRAASFLTRSETSREKSFLLRHFSTTPGRWMDLFDLDCFCNRQVPVLALDSQLIMYSACALAAKQLSAVSTIPARSLPYSFSTTDFDRRGEINDQKNYAYIATTYYDTTISLLLQRISAIASPNHLTSSTPTSETKSSSEICQSSGSIAHTLEHPSLELHDEVVVAVTILAVYEFLGGDTPTWSDHLDGTRSFLRIADEAGFLAFQRSPSLNNIANGPSGLLRATFWNFARQDMLSALIHIKHTRLEIHDFAMWRRMGVSLCSQGCLTVGNHSFHPEHNIDRIDLISNTLVWLLCRIVNFVASYVDDMESLEPSKSRETWNQLKSELEIWFAALPRIFQPCSRVELSQIRSSGERNGCCNRAKSLIQHETWYSNGMCASTMQSYYMAQIILTLYKPRSHQTRSAVPNSHTNIPRPRKSVDALSELNRISAELQTHAIEICAIAISHPEEAARVHMLQPLYLAGRCLGDPSDRATVVNLIESIEDELGWHAKYRVEALLEEWNMTRGTLRCWY